MPIAQGARRRYLVEITIGFVIGVLSGMVGMLLGSLRLPEMIRWLGVDARKAVGTNMAIGLAQGLAATVGHLAQGQVVLTPLAVVGARRRWSGLTWGRTSPGGCRCRFSSGRLELCCW